MSERLNECMPPSRHYVADLPLFPASLPESRQGGLVILKCKALRAATLVRFNDSREGVLVGHDVIPNDVNGVFRQRA
ncbi:hypothetical protein C0Q70_16874 [Pomacea canaliculata]|uniref:Uncharacterized protein n=1 Tax=Pomacea canaliculata TaxID=400727 RepID=A0A2T7NR25_POMCA|nr:hypothetical protein C0Q70_16874 [Pomacea canaliculata]